MAAPRVKAEQGVKPEPGLKPEADNIGRSPSAMSEDDIYEDAGDLEFYEPNDSNNGVYLAHVPKYLYDAWANMDDDAEIKIGTFRQWSEKGPDGQPKVNQGLL